MLTKPLNTNTHIFDSHVLQVLFLIMLKTQCYSLTKWNKILLIFFSQKIKCIKYFAESMFCVHV